MLIKSALRASLPALIVILTPGEESPVDQPKGKPSYGQAKGQLWSTRAFYAECAQYSKHMRQSVVNASPAGRLPISSQPRIFRTYPQGFTQLLSEKGACVTCFPSRLTVILSDREESP